MVSFMGGRATTSLYAGAVKGKANEKRSSRTGKIPTTAGTAPFRTRPRDVDDSRMTVRKGDTMSTTLADKEAKYERIDADMVVQSECFSGRQRASRSRHKVHGVVQHVNSGLEVVACSRLSVPEQSLDMGRYLRSWRVRRPLTARPRWQT